ncbi:hypothetical protein [Candidatus Desulfatibia sp.]|uniref:hypothetical protein n=1 Tax=Candidatus Desulfatibia sp. TaxID=3101189 RepID=UPI0039B878FC
MFNSCKNATGTESTPNIDITSFAHAHFAEFSGVNASLMLTVKNQCICTIFSVQQTIICGYWIALSHYFEHGI